MQAHINILTNRPYSGKNWMELETTRSHFQYKTNLWGTFKQLQSAGIKVKKGEHSHAHVFQGFAQFAIEEMKNDQKVIRMESRPIGYAPVFNLDQTNYNEIQAEKKSIQTEETKKSIYLNPEEMEQSKRTMQTVYMPF
jgi:antirestriction protein ArdC